VRGSDCVWPAWKEPPRGSSRVALSSLAVNEYFRDEKNPAVLRLLIISFRLSKAGQKSQKSARTHAQRQWGTRPLGDARAILQERIFHQEGIDHFFQAITCPTGCISTTRHRPQLSRPRCERSRRNAPSLMGILSAVVPCGSPPSALAPEIVGKGPRMR